ncbi:MAG: hypothetical protein AB8U25_03470 [Rickettsiales endosymbiont of Dermacentor nuttalli]
MFDIAWSELLVVVVLGWLLTDPKEYAEVIKGITSCMRKISVIRNEIRTTLMDIGDECAFYSNTKNTYNNDKNQYLKQLYNLYYEAEYNKTKDDNTTIH